MQVNEKQGSGLRSMALFKHSSAGLALAEPLLRSRQKAAIGRLAHCSSKPGHHISLSAPTVSRMSMLGS